jgi:pyruvate/2-oxoglutarate dehydrogenase complex dihydrolipoamide acyltransferase (E2) component
MAKMNYMVVEGKGKSGALIRKEGPLDLRALPAWSDEIADQCEADSVRVLFALAPIPVKRQLVTVVDVPEDLTAGPKGTEAKPKRKRRTREEMAAARAAAGGAGAESPRPTPSPAAPSAPAVIPGQPIPEGYFDAGGFLLRKPVPATPESLQALAKEFGVDPNEIEQDRGGRVNFTKAGRPRLKRGKRKADGTTPGPSTTRYETQPSA